MKKVGRPSKPVSEKILTGNPGKRPLTLLEFPAVEIKDTPPPEAPIWLTDGAEEIFNQTVAWLKKTGALSMINPAHIEEYAQCRARWLQCERHMESGLVFENVQGNKVISPYAKHGLAALKQADNAWHKIFAVVKDACTKPLEKNPHEDVMERLLAGKK